MSPLLIQHIANKLALRDLEHSGHQEPEDFYLDFAEIAAKAYEQFELAPRERTEYVEGLHFL